MASQRDLKRAKKLYENFRESPMRRGRWVDIDIPKVLAVLGNITAIEYDTTRRKKTEKYRHDFAIGSRPLFCVGNGQILIVGGRYRVTAGGPLEGIVDLDAKGQEIDDGH